MNEVRRTYGSLNDVLEVVQGILQFSEFDEAGVLPTVHDRGFFGSTPLLVVTGWGDVDAAKLLLDGGADVNAKGEHGYTPLHTAASKNNMELISLLLAYGASVTDRTEDNHTALEIATFSRNVDAAKLISEHISSARTDGA